MAGTGSQGNETATAVFTLEELWLLQSVIRHEVAQRDQWRTPPGDEELNSVVAESILRCEQLSLTEAAVVLRWEDCLVIDYCVPQTAKSAAGVPIGKNVLMKSFLARKHIREGVDSEPTSEEPGTPSSSEIRERLRKINGG